MQRPIQPGPATSSCNSVDEILSVLNVIVTVLVILFVSLAMGQVVIFNLTKETKKNLMVHTAIAYLGMGAAGYTLFVAPMHFSRGGWVGLVMTVIGIVSLGAVIQKLRKKKKAKSKKKKEIPASKIVSWEPDETKSWCLKCREHTKTTKTGRCSNCGADGIRLMIPVGNRKASYGCGGCAAVPVLISIGALLAIPHGDAGLAITVLMAFSFLLIIGFPIFFVYQYRTWLKWAKRRKMNPVRAVPVEAGSEEESEGTESEPAADGDSSEMRSEPDARDWFLRDEDL